MHPRHLIARIGIALAAAGMLIPIGAGTVAAIPLICEHGDVTYSITSWSKDVAKTHDYVWTTLAPGGHATRTVHSSFSFMASITVSGSTTGNANIIFAKAEVKVGFELQASGTWTNSEDFTTGITNSTSTTHRYVFFQGTRRGQGTWSSKRCSSNTWQNYGSGTWLSFEGTANGVIRCDQDSLMADKYGTDSMEFKAALSC
jgi:hypothetical protein